MTRNPSPPSSVRATGETPATRPAMPPLAAARAARAARLAAGLATTMDPIERAAANPGSLRAAVNGKCFDCVGADADPNPRGRIRACPSSRCPLHPVRPYQREATS